ncbi:MAG TPA: 30S ribosomal protein S24e [Candidatus Altiarchaeales archaeon]|nr:30S ribosomal protein S24e [Candidatus Altiarchaeales archaeon]
MEIEITQDKENPLLKRREVKFNLTYEGTTPAREEVKSKISAMLDSDPKLTVVDRIMPEYGKTSAKGYVKVYEDEESLAIEPDYMIERNKTKGEPKSEAKEGGGSE